MQFQPFLSVHFSVIKYMDIVVELPIVFLFLYYDLIIFLSTIVSGTKFIHVDEFFKDFI